MKPALIATCITAGAILAVTLDNSPAGQIVAESDGIEKGWGR